MIARVTNDGKTITASYLKDSKNNIIDSDLKPEIKRNIENKSFKDANELKRAINGANQSVPVGNPEPPPPEPKKMDELFKSLNHDQNKDKLMIKYGLEEKTIKSNTNDAEIIKILDDIKNQIENKTINTEEELTEALKKVNDLKEQKGVKITKSSDKFNEFFNNPIFNSKNALTYLNFINQVFSNGGKLGTDLLNSNNINNVNKENGENCYEKIANYVFNKLSPTTTVDDLIQFINNASNFQSSSIVFVKDPTLLGKKKTHENLNMGNDINNSYKQYIESYPTDGNFPDDYITRNKDKFVQNMNIKSTQDWLRVMEAIYGIHDSQNDLDEDY